MEATPWWLACVIIAHCDPFYRQREMGDVECANSTAVWLFVPVCLACFLVQQRDSGQRHRELKGKLKKTPLITQAVLILYIHE